VQGVRIIYATRLIAAAPLDTRLPRAAQSQAARALLDRITAGTHMAFSKSHSRTAVAVAASHNAGVSVGIDIEWMAPERPFTTVALGYLGTAAAGVAVSDFYRAWTFYEAFFKAFQRPPAPAAIEETLSSSARSVCQLRDGTRVIQHCVADGFQLSLVWSGGDCVPVYLGERVCD